MKNAFLIVLILLSFHASVLSAQENLAQAITVKAERIQEQLIGPVKTVLVEFSKIKKVGGKWIPEDLRTPWLLTTYNRKGYRMQEDQLYLDRLLDFKSIFTYDSLGQLSKGTEYDHKEKVTFQWTYKHHVSENRIEENRSFPNGTSFSTINYLYDPMGNLIEEKHKLEQTQNYFRWVYQYDAGGRKTEESYYLSRPEAQEGKMKSLLNFRVVFLYDSQDNLIKETRFNAAGQAISNKHFQYTYDKTGNWISQTAEEAVVTSGEAVLEPTEITYRTITYYQP